MEYSVSIHGKIDNIELRNIVNELNTMYLNSLEKVAYYYEDISTGTVFSFNKDILFYAASSIKILVCVIALEMVDRKDLDIDSKILITMNDIKRGTGVIKNQSKDTYYSLKELIKLCLIESDNTAYIKLVNLIGKDKIILYGNKLGAKHTMEGKDLFGIINCSDMLIYWKKIRKYIENGNYGKELYNWLSNTSTKIIDSKNIGENNFVRKYGSFGIAYHECGYVCDDNPFYLIILTEKNNINDKKKFINYSAKLIYKLHKLINNKTDGGEICE